MAGIRQTKNFTPEKRREFCLTNERDLREGPLLSWITIIYIYWKGFNLEAYLSTFVSKPLDMYRLDYEISAY